MRRKQLIQVKITYVLRTLLTTSLLSTRYFIIYVVNNNNELLVTIQDNHQL